MTRIGAFTLKYDPENHHPRKLLVYVVENGKDVLADFVGASLVMRQFEIVGVRYERRA